MPPAAYLLRDTLVNPAKSRHYTLADWELLIRQARVSQLMPRLAVQMQEAALYREVPDAARKYLDVALSLRDRQHVAAINEIYMIQEALASIDVALVLLKGAAYIAADLPPARCRVFSDFDIIVPKDRLDEVELVMLTHGWATTHTTAYDQRYYRDWMHELPPMRNSRRQSYLDIHHNILPETAYLCPDPSRLLKEAVPSGRYEGVNVLGPADMILHCIVHLFQDGEFERGLRDLFDIYDLLTQFMTDAAAWERLTDRALELGLERPLWHALTQVARQLQFDVPAGAFAALRSAKPSRMTAAVMSAALDRGFLPHHESCRGRGARLARIFLFARGHALKMPPHLLIVHLSRKWLQSMHLISPSV